MTIGIDPTMRGELKAFQPNPIQFERLLQGRASSAEQEPTHTSSKTRRSGLAMDKMSAAALVSGTDPNAYFAEVIEHIGAAAGPSQT